MEKTETPAEIPVGVVEMINPEQKFVLISLTPGYLVTTGTKLYTYSPSGLRAELKVTPERKFSFLAADILEGYPQKGKPVFASREALAKALNAGAAATDQNSSAIPPPPDPNLNWGGLPGSDIEMNPNPQASPAPLPAPSSNPSPELPPLNNPFLQSSPEQEKPSP